MLAEPLFFLFLSVFLLRLTIFVFFFYLQDSFSLAIEGIAANNAVAREVHAWRISVFLSFLALVARFALKALDREKIY